VLIAIKHVAIIYACNHWPVPFHQLWINAPTFALGLLATVVYYGRR
jgi:membrane protease YdiL (CAAX protease family)